MKKIRELLIIPAMVTQLCASAIHPAAANETLRVAYLSGLWIIPHLYANEKEFFKANGIDVTMTILNNGPAVVGAVVSGAADVGFSATVPIIVAKAQNQPIQAFISDDFERYPRPVFTFLIASAHSGIKTVADMKGKTIASNASKSGCDLQIRDFLRTAGVSVDSVKMVTMPFPQMKQALELDNIDAACVVDPFYNDIKESEKIKPVVLGSGLISNLRQVGGIPLDAYFARQDWLEKNEKTALAFTRAISKANRELMQHRDDYRALLIKQFKMPAPLASKVPVELNIGDLTAHAQDYQPLIDALVRNKMLSKTLPASDVVYALKH